MGILNIVGYALSGTTRVRPAAASLQTACCVVLPARSYSSSKKGLLNVKKSLLSFITRAGLQSTNTRRGCSFGLLGLVAARKCATSTVLCSKYLARTVLKPKHLFNRKSSSTIKVNPNLSQDVLVFSHTNDKFYKALAIFGVFQMIIWGYFSIFAVQYLKAPPSQTSKVDTSDLPWWKYLLYKEGQYKNALSVLCFSLGGVVLFMTMAYPRRAVRNLWLLRGGNEVQITTYSWFGQTQTFRKPLEHVSFVQSRTGSGHHVPFKVKGKSFFYLLDKQGSFHNTDLFDFVIGFKRQL